VNLVRAHGVSAEEALRVANAKFERRFRAMEALAKAQGRDFADLPLDDQEALWQQVKASEANETT
jgi:ATP diphosphatase